jgi:hypothetical protein
VEATFYRRRIEVGFEFGKLTIDCEARKMGFAIRLRITVF